MRPKYLSLAGLVILLLFIPIAPADDFVWDLDVGVPPGTPLEWDNEFRQPVPTGGRGDVPTTDKTPDKKSEKVPRGMTVAEDKTPKPPNFDYGLTNLYESCEWLGRNPSRRSTGTVSAIASPLQVTQASTPLVR